MQDVQEGGESISSFTLPVLMRFLSIFLSKEKMYAVMWDIFSSNSGLYLIYRVTILLKNTRW